MIDEAQSAAALDRFARNTIELRCRAGLSQVDAGMRAGLHRTEVSMLERRLRMPRFDTILRIAGGVEAEPRELLEGLAWDLGCDLSRDRKPTSDRREVREARPSRPANSRPTMKAAR
jgi:transcriptional regulator with XRE-family HTH domain